MMRTLIRTAILAAAAVTLTAQTAAFRFERPIVAGGAGPRRLPIDVPLLAGGNPFRVVSHTVNQSTGEISVALAGGPTDLRLFDASGRETGYLLVTPPSAEPVWKAGEILATAPVETEKEKTSGFEADFHEARNVDRVRIAGLAPPFLKRVRLEGSGDRAHWTLLVNEGTLFDLPEERLREIELGFTSGTYRYLRATWDDARSGRLPLPRIVEARLTDRAAPAPTLTTPLTLEKRAGEPGISRFRLRLPAARLPIVALDLDIAGGHVMRRVTVEEARFTGSELVPARIGEWTVRRVVRDGVAASALRVPIVPPAESQIDLVVADEDNPPLDLRGVTAVFAPLPWIYFESDGTALTARYGNTSLGAPRYDLEATRDTLRIDAVADASWGEARPRSAEENAGTPPPAQTVPTGGAPLDVSTFKYLRPLDTNAAGLIVVPLDAPALAHSTGVSGQFSDVRVVDGGGRQVPYVMERSSEPISLDLSIERETNPPKALEWHQGARSVYRVRLPIDRLPQARLVLTTSARVFQRPVAIAVARQPDQRRRDVWIQTLAAVNWVHSDQDRPTPALTVRLPPFQASEALIVVDEGDNSALPIESARLLLPSFKLRLYRERSAALRLAYGRSDIASPRYDLALLAPQVLGVPATEVSPGPEPSAASQAPLLSPRLFWTVLIVAVIVITGLIARLLMKEQTS